MKHRRHRPATYVPRRKMPPKADHERWRLEVDEEIRADDDAGDPPSRSGATS